MKSKEDVIRYVNEVVIFPFSEIIFQDFLWKIW